MEANLNNEGMLVDTSKDSIVIINYIDGIPGGRTLDTTGITSEVLKAGHVIIKEDATGTHKPMPVTTAGAYDTLQEGHSYVGVLAASILIAKPFAAILLRGTVNEVASPYAPTSDIKTALKHIIFTQD